MNLPIPSATLARLNPHLFGRIGRPSELNPFAVVREAALHDAIYDECRRRGWISFHGSMSERTHRTAGEPDFVILADEGRLLLVECKSRTGKLSLAQAALIKQAEGLKNPVHVVRSLEEFLNIL